MVGTGEGRFSPDAELSTAECLTLALRLYDLQRGGDGMMEKAPEDWGKLTLTLNDGTVFQGYGEVYHPFAWSDGEDGGLYVSCEDYGTTLWEEEVWGNARLGPATVSIDGKDIPGTMRIHMGVSDFLLFFDPDNAGDNELIKNTYSEDAPSPQKWYRDAAYTVKAWGLRDDKHPGFSGLLEWSGSDLDHPADREEFALALYDAAGKLEKKFSVDAIHDVYNGESRFLTREEHGGIFALYEAGILGGINEFGTFGGHEDLTRAEAATMVARILDPSQRLTSAPTPPNAYDQAVAELRNGFTYYAPSERTYETEDCTIFVYDRGGAMHTGPGNITIIYKPGSQLGVGAIVEGETLDYATYLSGPDRMDFNAEANTLTYAYRVEEDIIGSEGYPSYPAGIHTFTVDLPTGETTRSYAPFSLEGSVEVLAKGRNYTLEQRLDGKDCAVILRWKPLTWTDDTRDYELWLVKGDGSIQKLLLPSTVLDSVYHYTPTDRAPDSLTLSADGRTLTYTYHFDEALEDYHEAGTYTYTVDLATGELRVEFLPPYEAAVADIFQLDSFQLDRRLETSQCSIIAGTYRAAHVPRACVALVYKPGSLPGPGTCVFLPTQGGVDTSYSSILPDAMDLSQDGTTLTYTYHFNADGYALDKTYTEHLTQVAGTHTYTVDLTTGEYVYAHTEN